MLIYIHGFNSSPASFKASQLAEYADKHRIADRLWIPALSSQPQKAIQQLTRIIEQSMDEQRRSVNDKPVSLIGSSLGGYYATWLAEQYDCRAVLINPAVRPYELLDEFIGDNTNYYTGETYTLSREHLDQLHEIDVEAITKPDRYLLMLQSGDEVLDYTVALDKYKAVPSIVEEGGSHEFMGFDRHIETVFAFCGINCLKTYS